MASARDLASGVLHCLEVLEAQRAHIHGVVIRMRRVALRSAAAAKDHTVFFMTSVDLDSVVLYSLHSLAAGSKMSFG